VRALLGRFWDVSSQLAAAGERATDLETQNLTLLARVQSLEDDLTGREGELAQAREGLRSLDEAVGSMRENVSALQSATHALQSELQDRDRFLHHVYAQLSLPLRDTPTPHPLASGPTTPRHNSRSHEPPAMPDGPARYTSLLTDSVDTSLASHDASPSRRPPLASSLDGPSNNPPPDFQALQASVSGFVRDLLGRLGRLQRERDELSAAVKRKDVDLEEVRQAHIFHTTHISHNPQRIFHPSYTFHSHSESTPLQPPPPPFPRSAPCTATS
jgi:hypothetical protein